MKNDLSKKFGNKYFRRRVCALAIVAAVLFLIVFNVLRMITSNAVLQKKKEYEQKLFGTFQDRSAEVDKFYTYGNHLGVEGRLSNIGLDNFENAKLVLVDSNCNEQEIPMTGTITDGTLYFSVSEINNSVSLDNMQPGEFYFLKLRIKSNNSAQPRYYMFENNSSYPQIDYYTITKDGANKKVVINFDTYTPVEGKKFTYLVCKAEDATLPDDVYDIVIDAGHGGKDNGYTAGGYTEAKVTLDVSKILKTKLENAGYKVKMTRDDANDSTFTKTNMYDSNGRITIACKSRAKLMISIHITDGSQNMTGCEVYAPSRSNLNLARLLANKMVEQTDIDFSNDSDYRQFDGVYVRNYTKLLISNMEKQAEREGYEPYNVDENTSYIYSIREVGGIATNAYIDGRDKVYSKNEYYNSNQGIESYQINLGYIDNDLQTVLTQKEGYTTAITQAIEEYLK